MNNVSLDSNNDLNDKRVICKVSRSNKVPQRGTKSLIGKSKETIEKKLLTDSSLHSPPVQE
jgi:hypothetical protein